MTTTNNSNSFLVNSLADVIDANDGVTTLREAIAAANSQSGQNTIAFDLASDAQIDLTGRLEIIDDLIINGGGVTIAGNGTFDNFFISNADVVFDGLTITNGSDGIEVGGGTSLTLTNSAVVNNADDGIDLNGADNTLSISGSAINNNGGNGVEIDASSSTITVSNSSFTGNSGDGIGFDEGGNNTLTLVNADLSGNTGDGLDVNSSGNNITITNANLDGNGIGAAIEVEDGLEIDGNNNTVTLSNASLTGNTGDGLDIDGTAAFNSVTLSNTSVSGNSEDGVEIDGSNNSLSAVNGSFTDNTGDGIDVNSSGNNVTLSNVNLSGNGVGAAIEVEDGLEIDGSNNTITVSNASFNNNPGDGVDFNGSNNNVSLSGVAITGNGEDGVEISLESNDNTLVVVNSAFSNNAGEAIADLGSGNTVSVSNSTGVPTFISIENAGFEVPALEDGEFTVLQAIPGWQPYDPDSLIAPDGTDVGAFNPLVAQYPNDIPGGANVGYAFSVDPLGAGVVGLSQTLDELLHPGTSYSLQVEVGNPTGIDQFGTDYTGFPGYRVELLAGNTVLATDNSTLNIAEGTFGTSTVSYTAAATDPFLGEQLGIRLINPVQGSGFEVDFDNVRLTATQI